MKLNQLHARITPMSSIVGTSVQLCDDNGRVYCMLALVGTTPDKEYKDWAPSIATELAALINNNKAN